LKLTFMKPMPPIPMLANDDRPDVETLAAVIARSQILVAAPVKALSVKDLPAGYDDVDVAILDWIAAEGRRAGRGLAPM
jgi:hypothetical protein